MVLRRQFWGNGEGDIGWTRVVAALLTFALTTAFVLAIPSRRQLYAGCRCRGLNCFAFWPLVAGGVSVGADVFTHHGAIQFSPVAGFTLCGNRAPERRGVRQANRGVKAGTVGKAGAVAGLRGGERSKGEQGGGGGGENEGFHYLCPKIVDGVAPWEEPSSGSPWAIRCLRKAIREQNAHVNEKSVSFLRKKVV